MLQLIIMNEIIGTHPYKNSHRVKKSPSRKLDLQNILNKRLIYQLAYLAFIPFFFVSKVNPKSTENKESDIRENTQLEREETDGGAYVIIKRVNGQVVTEIIDPDGNRTPLGPHLGG